MTYSTFSSYAALLTRFALLLLAIMPVAYGTPWLLNVLFALIVLILNVVLLVSYWLYRRDLRRGYALLQGRKHSGFLNLGTHPRDRFYDAMICMAGLLIYGLTGVTYMIIVWAVILVVTLFHIVMNPQRDSD